MNWYTEPAPDMFWPYKESIVSYCVAELKGGTVALGYGNGTIRHGWKVKHLDTVHGM